MITDKRYYKQGKRGIVSLAQRQGEMVLVKEQHPRSRAATIAHEATVLALVNGHGIGPLLYEVLEGSIVMEFIDGVPIEEWLGEAPACEACAMLEEILRQCRLLDDLGLSKQEMTRPRKHILVREGRPVQVDFERARHTRRPQNVTQCCQWIAGSVVRPLLAAKGVVFERATLLEGAKAYKRTYAPEEFERIVEVLRMAFREMVYAKLKEVPAGKVTTYKDLAHALGSNAYRAVGQALRCNPYAPRVPCHRVVRANGTLGGFSGEVSGPQIERKKRLLQSEGVPIAKDSIVDFDARRHEF